MKGLYKGLILITADCIDQDTVEFVYNEQAYNEVKQNPRSQLYSNNVL